MFPEIFLEKEAVTNPAFGYEIFFYGAIKRTIEPVSFLSVCVCARVLNEELYQAFNILYWQYCSQLTTLTGELPLAAFHCSIVLGAPHEEFQQRYFSTGERRKRRSKRKGDRRGGSTEEGEQGGWSEDAFLSV